jgi:hypothetical protein
VQNVEPSGRGDPRQPVHGGRREDALHRGQAAAAAAGCATTKGRDAVPLTQLSVIIKEKPYRVPSHMIVRNGSVAPSFVGCTDHRAAVGFGAAAAALSAGAAARGYTVILTENDSNDSRISV